MLKNENKIGLTTIQLLVSGFVVIILLGTFLLMLSISVAGNEKISFIDALFTVTSAITTTGLVVVDTGSFFTIFGQVVIIILVQIGGLGYMIFLAMVMAGLRKRISFSSMYLLHESIGMPSSEDWLKFSTKIILFTLFFEMTGIVLLSFYWSKSFTVPEALYSGVFHSISAFCTAGFSLYPDGFIAYRDSIFFNGTVILICIAGSIGFIVLNDLYVFGKQIIHRKYPRRFSEHTKLAVLVMTILIIMGIILMYFVPGQTVASHAKERLLFSIFQIVTASTTTGFNTVNIGTLAVPILWVITILMFIGCCPGGTGGGIKTTTFGLILSSVRSMFMGREDITVFQRKVSSEMIMRAYSVAIIAMIWVIIASGILFVTESGLSVQSILFEVSSAFGTVGLSAGITPLLSPTGKIIITFTMFLGRIGPVAIGYSLVGKPPHAKYTYPKAEILVG